MSLILNGTTGISDVDGTAAAPALTGTDTNTGIFFPAADNIAFAEGGTEVMRIDSSGNVGIGTSSPAGNLHVYANGTNVDIQTSNNSNFSKIRFKGSGGAVGGQISGLGGGAGVAFYYSTTEAARIDSSGNVLVTSAAGLGYGTGAGGTVTQATNKGTAVTLNKPTGQVTTNNAALAAGATVSFSINNSIISATDVIVLAVTGGSSYTVQPQFVSGGVANIRLTNTTGGSLSEAVAINFAVIKGATS